MQGHPCTSRETGAMHILDLPQELLCRIYEYSANSHLQEVRSDVYSFRVRYAYNGQRRKAS